ncbi:MAG: saccharopine dehydrogenase C-terminal domain-containing protein [Candidatus Edwardsbacteria bacterium]
MKVLIFGGSGKIGSAVAWDLAKDNEIEEIGIVGRRKDALEKTKNWIGSKKVKCHVLDISNKKDTVRLMKQYNVGAIALPDRRSSYKVVESSLEARLNIVDMLEEFHRTPDPYETEGLEIPKGMAIEEYGEWIHKRAVERGLTFVDGMGFAPGLSNITLGEGIRKVDTVEKAIARVGGIPSKESALRHPLKYMITWTFEHVLREYMIKLKVIKDGKIVEVDAGTEHERFRFTQFGKDEELECAITPGMPSFLFTRPYLKEFAEKTIRWPGHWEGIQTLKECGLLNLEPVEFKGVKISPRELFLSIITPKLQPSESDTDVCVMYNTLTGKKDSKNVKIEYFMWDEADTKNGISSMMRATGFPVAIAAKILLKGEIKDRGIVAPEDCIKGELYQKFIEELKKRNIDIREVVT